MEREFSYYKHSGEIGSCGPLLMMLFGIPGGLVLGGIYGYALLYVPVAEIHILLTLALGAAAGYLVTLGGRLGKVRNTGFLLLSGLIFGSFAEYFGWVSWIYAYSQQDILVIDPLKISAVMKSIAQTGGWSVFDWTPKGTALYIIWALEAIVIIGLSTFIPRKLLGTKPFCESCNQWIKDKDLILPLEPIDQPEEFRLQLEAGDATALEALEVIELGSEHFSKLEIYHCAACKEFYLLNVVNITLSQDSKGAIKEQSNHIIKNLIVGQELYEKIKESMPEDYQYSKSKAGSETPATAETPAKAKFGLSTLALIIAIGISVFGIISYNKARSREVYLINGLDKPYTIKIADQSYILDPNQPTLINVPEGSLEVTVPDESFSIARQNIEIKTSFWSRPFHNAIFLLNPDSVAPIYWEKVYYAGEGDDPPQGNNDLFVGQTLYVFEDIDFIFDPFPETIALVPGIHVAKERLSLLSDIELGPVQITTMLADLKGKEVAVEYLKKEIQYYPHKDIYINLLYGQTEPEKFIEIIQPGLDEYPVRIDLHRLYQEAMEKTDSQYNIETEYRSRLEKNTKNPALQYLLGRTMRDPREAEILYQQSVSGENPCSYGYNAMAYQKMSISEYEQALQNARKAIQIEPDSFNFRHSLRSALEAAGHYDEAIAEYRKEQQKNPASFIFIIGEIRLLLRKSGIEQAQDRINVIKARITELYGEQLLDYLETYIGAEVAYLTGDLQKYRELKQDSPSAGERIKCALTCSGPIDDNLLAELEQTDPYIYLLLYIAEQRSGKKELSDKHLRVALNLLKKERWEHKFIADCLAGKETSVPDIICALPMLPKEKAILLAVLGVKYPEQKNVYFELANKLNYDRSFPHLFLKSLFEQEGGM